MAPGQAPRAITLANSWPDLDGVIWRSVTMALWADRGG